MDKIIALTPALAGQMMFLSATIAVIGVCFYTMACIVVDHFNIGEKICNGVCSFFSKIRRRIHG